MQSEFGSFLISFAFAKFNPVILFLSSKPLPKSKSVCSNLIEVVKGSTSVLAILAPLWFVTLFVSGVFYIFLVAILVYMMPWLIGKTRREIYITLNVGLKKLRSFGSV